jgi:molybdate transport repressor ModE-like protein
VAAGQLRDIEMRHLQALQAVAEEGSFGRAAKRLGFSQSAVSQQIGALERVLGEPVFDRPGGPRRVELTPVGQMLLEHADAVLGRIRQAEDDLERLRHGGAGQLVIGTFQSVSVRILPTIVRRMRTEVPGVLIKAVESDYNESLLDGVESGELDLAFTTGQQPDDRFDFVHLCVDPFVVLSTSPAPRSAIATGQLGGAPLIGEQVGACSTLIENGLRQLGIEPHYVFRTNDNAAVQAMVRAGMGQAIMPFLAVDDTDPGVVVRDMNPPLPPRRIDLVRRRGRTLHPAARRFSSLAVEVAASLGKPGFLGAASPDARLARTDEFAYPR